MVTLVSIQVPLFTHFFSRIFIPDLPLKPDFGSRDYYAPYESSLLEIVPEVGSLFT